MGCPRPRGEPGSSAKTRPRPLGLAFRSSTRSRLRIMEYVSRNWLSSLVAAPAAAAAAGALAHSRVACAGSAVGSATATAARPAHPSACAARRSPQAAARPSRRLSPSPQSPTRAAPPGPPSAVGNAAPRSASQAHAHRHARPRAAWPPFAAQHSQCARRAKRTQHVERAHCLPAPPACTRQAAARGRPCHRACAVTGTRRS